MESDSVSVVSSTLPRSTKTWSSVRPSVCVCVCVCVEPTKSSSSLPLTRLFVHSEHPVYIPVCTMLANCAQRHDSASVTLNRRCVQLSFLCQCHPHLSARRSAFRLSLVFVPASDRERGSTTEVRARALLHFVVILHSCLALRMCLL